MTVKELSSEVKTPASAVSWLHSSFPLKYKYETIVENVTSRLAEREIPKGLSLWLSGVLLTCRLYKLEYYNILACWRRTRTKSGKYGLPRDV